MDKTTNGELIMCLGGGGSPKVEVPKPAPLPPPLPAPPPPVQQTPKKPQVVQKIGLQVPDIRIGAAKQQRSSTSRPRAAGSIAPGKQSLSIGNNQGLNI